MKGLLRPIEEWETPYLEAMGRRVRELRLDRGLTQAAVARRAEMSPSHVGRIENGKRRVRRSTLERLLPALVDEDLVGEYLDELVELAGPALASESDYRERVERRRARRFDRARADMRQSLTSMEATLAGARRLGDVRLVREAEYMVEKIRAEIADLREPGATEAQASPPATEGEPDR